MSINSTEMNLSFSNGGAFVRVPLSTDISGFKETLEIAVFVPETEAMTTFELFQAAMDRAQKLISLVQKPSN